MVVSSSSSELLGPEKIFCRVVRPTILQSSRSTGGCLDGLPTEVVVPPCVAAPTTGAWGSRGGIMLIRCLDNEEFYQ